MGDIRLVVVAGLRRDATGWVADQLLRAEPGTVVVHHDLSALAEGIVRRRVRFGPGDGLVAGEVRSSAAGPLRPSKRLDGERAVAQSGEVGRDFITVLELAHGCVSCTLREDTLPLLRKLVALPGVRRVVLHLDPAMEPESVCWALHNVLVGDVVIGDLVAVDGVVGVVDQRDWLAAATGDEPLGLGPDDDRTLAQVAVGQVEFADAIVVTGQTDEWTAARTAAVLDRLVPGAPRAASVHGLLDAVAADARRGSVTDAHAPLLWRSPPLDVDCGVALTVFEARRPFHPGRLYRAIDALLAGVVRSRGRIWVATQPDVALWLESAGGGLRVGHAGAWLAAVDDGAWRRASPERRAKAAVDWHPRWGDRMQEIVILSHDASPDDIVAVLRDALLTDDELTNDWQAYEDPFMARETLEDKA